MKYLIVFFGALCFGTLSYGQLTKNALQGHWRVEKIVKKSPNPELRGVMDGFKHATFIFLENGNFQLKTESKAPAFQMILRMIEKAKWKFDSDKQQIQIGNEADGYSIMGIYVKQKEAKLEFSLEESEMVLEMKKIG